MLKLAIRVPVLSVALLGGSLILADGMIVAALMASFVTLVLLAAIARILGSARSHGPARHILQAGTKPSAAAAVPSRRP